MRRSASKEANALGITERLENQLKSLYAAMRDGSDAFADEDLEFTSIVNTASDIWFLLSHC